MKKVSVILAVLSIIASEGLAQIPNGGFEVWGNYTDPGNTGNVYQKPNGWLGFLPSSPLTYSFSVAKNSDSYPAGSGQYSMLITNNLGAGVNGVAVSYNSPPASNLKTSWPNIPPAFPIYFRPKFFCLYYKYVPVGGDSMRVSSYFYKKGSKIGEATYVSPQTVTTWTLLTVPVAFSTSDVPDSAAIVLCVFSSAQHDGSKLYVDNLSFDRPFTSIWPASEWRIDSTGTLDGHAGYYQSMKVNGTLNETDFMFVENNFVRWYAFRMSGQSSFTLLPDSTYMPKVATLNIGDTWNSWVSQPTKSVVADTTTVSVAVGSLKAFVIKSYLKSRPDSLIYTGCYVDNIGQVKISYRGGVSTLSSYSMTGGSGFLPLSVGNWWRMDSATAVTGVEQHRTPVTPQGFELSQNYPNPFNPSTTIRFELQKEGYVSLKIFNMLGQLAATLIDEPRRAGSYQIEWNASNVPSGTYFYRLQTAGVVETRKMIVIK